jgi:hypothetical protein
VGFMPWPLHIRLQCPGTHGRVNLSGDVDFVVKPEKCLSQAGNEFLFPVRPSRILLTVLTKLSGLPCSSYGSSYCIDSH